MRKLIRPAVNDGDVLDAVAGRQPLALCSHLEADKLEVHRRYAQYLDVAGNAAAGTAPRPVVLPGRLQNTLLAKYDSGAELYAYIGEIRDAQNINACPMCGAPNLGSVDHVFPRTKFPEFAIFSPNLVPACLSCNSARKDNYLGVLPGERVLHPYFDSYLEERLITAKIARTNGTFRKATITVEILIHIMHPLYPVMRFHLKEVVLKTKIFKELDKLWVAFQRKSDVYFQSLPEGAFTDRQMLSAIVKSLKLSDSEFSTPNNWKSILLFGLAENPEAIAYLGETIRAIRVGALNPDDI